MLNSCKNQGVGADKWFIMINKIKSMLQSGTFGGQVVGEVQNGYVALVGVTHDDTQSEAELLAKKTAHLRVFEDDAGKMNISGIDTGAGILVISQFT